MTDKETLEYESVILKKADWGGIAKRLENDPDWQHVLKIAANIAKLTHLNMTKVDPIKDPGKLIRLQVKYELYGEFAQNLTQALFMEGEQAYELGRELGIIKSNATEID